MSTAVVNPKFGELHKLAADAFATAVIFQRRARKYGRLVRLLTFFGLAIPGAIGAIVLAKLLNNSLLEYFIYAAGALGVIQFLFSVWSVVSNWPESLDYSSAASADNFRLSDQMKALAGQAASPPAELVAWDNSQNLQDNKRNISDAELMYGHRAALLQFRLKCTACAKDPLSRKLAFFPWNRCAVCGGPKK
jgi:mobilome CxxCx(11)CxxC protein